jgi:hypothetical protein
VVFGLDWIGEAEEPLDIGENDLGHDPLQELFLESLTDVQTE